MKIISKLRAFRKFLRHPFGYSITLYGSLYGIGDQVRQQLQGVPQKDYAHSARMTFIGGGVLAPVYYGWYKALDYALKGKSTNTVLIKIALDQIIAGSAGIGLFYTG